MTGSGSLALLRQIVELLKRNPITTLLQEPKDKWVQNTVFCLEVPAGGRKVLLPTQRSGAPLLTWTQRLGWPFSKGNSRASCGTKGMGGVLRGGPLGLPSSSDPGLAFLLRFAYVHSDIFPGQRWDQRLAGAPARCLPAQCGLGGQRAWRDQPPAPWGQQLQPGSPPEVTVCPGICRERARSLLAHTRPSAPIPPWPLRVLSPFLNGQMLVLTESGSRGHT